MQQTPASGPDDDNNMGDIPRRSMRGKLFSVL